MTYQACRVFVVMLGFWAALCALPYSVLAENYYVTPTGAGDYGGTNWDNAYSNVQAAATLAIANGDNIYIQGGVYSNAGQIAISNALGLTIYGGRYGYGISSNAYSGTNSTLTKTGGVMRIVAGYASTVTVAGVTISGGRFTNGANYGAGMFFTNCVVTLTNCVVCANSNRHSGTSVNGYGGGLYCSGGSLAVYDCVFSNNNHDGGVSPCGGGLAGVNTPMTIAGTLFVNNTVPGGSSWKAYCGGAIYSYGAAVLVTNCEFRGNFVSGHVSGYGGAVYISGGSAVIVYSSFVSNNANNVNGYGGAVCLAGLQSATVRSNLFSDNIAYGWPTYQGYGGAVYVANCQTTTLDNCRVESRGQIARAEHLYFSGATNTFILNTVVRGNLYHRGIYFAGAACSLVMTNCWVADNGSDGILLAGGTGTVAHCVFANNTGRGVNWSSAGALAMSNCLLTQNGSEGLMLSSGVATVANCTLADNGSWGCNLTGGTGTVLNSIAWGNGSGGFASNASLGVTYSCSQNMPFGAGTGNVLGDPLFAPVPGYYYLSETSLAEQTNHSPCIDTGFGQASDYGLDTSTTRTDGSNDIGLVDLGYHYTNGASVPHLVLVCYVDAVGGDNGNSGLAWTSAWKSVTYAMTNVSANATINLATGVYSFATTEELFPLAVQMANLTLAASNSLSALTVLDNAGTSGRRVLQASSAKGAILLKGLTFRGGYFPTNENNGAGLSFQSCAVTLTNCVVCANSNRHSGTSVNGYGGGLYCSGGSLAVYDCVFSNNNHDGGVSPCGGGLAGVNTPMTIAGTLFVNNTVPGGSSGKAYRGGAIYSYGAAVLVTNCEFRGNFVSGHVSGYGGAVYISGGSAVIVYSSFVSNNANNVNGYGGAVCLAGLQSATVRSNLFSDNIAYGWPTYQGYGGAVYVANCQTTTLDNCRVESRGQIARAEHLYFSGATNTFILNTVVRGNLYHRGIYFAGAACSLVMTNCWVADNGSDGILLAGGTGTVAHCVFANNTGRGVNWSSAGALAMSNCLLTQNGSEGLMLSSGVATVANCTLADNGSWGCNLTGGTGTVLNSIAWGNGSGGFASNASLGVTYSCSQNMPFGAGTGNVLGDPLFAPVPGYYYLSETSLAEQTNHSPCIDTGFGQASDYGLDTSTTRTDGSNDIGLVDLGYHYTNGASVPHLVLVCYVDAVGGDNGNSGLAWTSAWKSVTYAMTNVSANATINLATGVYSFATTEELFPLAVQMANLTLAASNSLSALTVLDNAGTSGRRVLQASSAKGAILLKGLTFRGGYFPTNENNGAGLSFQSCAVTLTNCVVCANSNRHSGTSVNGYGGGLYCSGGSLAVYDCVFSNNNHDGGVSPCGGGLAGVNTPMTIAGTLFVNNTVPGGSSGKAYRGGAIYSYGAAVLVTNCEFRGNFVSGHVSGYGGAVYISGGSAVIVYSSFVSNNANNVNGYGGAVCLAGLQSATVRSNLFSDNIAYGWPTYQGYGGAVYVANCQTTTLDNCRVESRGQIARAEHLYFSGATNTFILNTVVRGNLYHRGIYFAGAACSLVMTNCWVADNGSDGILLAGGTGTVAHCVFANNTGRGVNWSSAGALAMSNCLLTQNGSEGLMLSSGVATVANCTLADNGSWGCNLTGGTGTVLNSIAWGNGSGGFASNASLGVTYSCSQNMPFGAGTGNVLGDPLFAPVPGYYYLSETSLAEQTNHSPCIDTGFGQASDYGLDTSTTRTDGSNDIGLVDLGYHYTNGASVPHLVLVCYVDAVGGDNGNSGLAWTSAWKSVTYAMTNVSANATINLATGVYSFATTEELFPLAVQMANLTLAASNSLSALTVLDNAGTSGRRVLQASSAKGAILLKGLTFRGGYFPTNENNGAGLSFQSCAVTLTNCVVCANSNRHSGTSVNGYGGGLYCSGGSLAVYDCVFSNNNHDGGVSPCGGGLAGVNTPMTIAGTLFVNNTVPGGSSGKAYRGGAIYSYGAAVLVTNCEFRGNFVSGHVSGYGGAVYISGGSAVIVYSSFVSNNANNVNGYGGAVCLAGLQSATVRSNLFSDNIAYGWPTYQGYGGAVYVANCQTTTLDNCRVESRGQIARAEHLYFSGATNTFILNTVVRGNLYHRGIYFAGAAASLALRNCLVANNNGDGILIAAGTATLVNCTFANNVGWGIVRPTSAALSVKNSILWGNTLGGIEDNQNLDLSYSDLQDSWAASKGIGNFMADPLFVDPAAGDYHEMGKEGSYHDGAWLPDGRNSLCLDAGDPASAWGLEPKQNGNRINLGAYGNTAEATRSLPKVGTVLCIW